MFISLEDANHLILQFNANEDIRRQMFDELHKMPNGIGSRIIEESNDILATLLRRCCPAVEIHENKDFLKVACQHTQ